MKALYWFRRDLRLRDNRALFEAASRSDKLVAIYVMDMDVLEWLEIGLNDGRLEFLLDALSKLGEEIRLHVFYGRTGEIFEEILGKWSFEAIYTATPLTWIEDEKVREVKELCRRSGVKFVEVLDNVLVDPSSIPPANNFARFYRRWRGLVDSSMAGEIPPEKFVEMDGPDLGELCRRHGWRIGGLGPWRIDWLHRRLNSFNFERYAELRDYPGLDGSSKLSPYISLGVASVRELYNRAASASEEFVRQLAWREFYYHLKMRYPWMRDVELKPHMRNIEWENDPYLIDAFKDGRTGYPIVDAGIRQLKSENWIHNRVRLIVANFLVKDLHVDWRIGEKFFRKYLIDYDEVLNVGNWQWAASVGVDPLPLRLFSPMRQSEKYDANCAYIKKYIPELEGHECRELHDPLRRRIRGYHEPIVDHNERIREFKKLVGRRYT